MDYCIAQQVLFEIFEVVDHSNADMFSLRESEGGFYGTGYSVVVKAFLSAVRKQEVYAIAKKHGLRIVESREGLTIFKPRQI